MIGWCNNGRSTRKARNFFLMRTSWMILLSSQIDKYKRIVEKKEKLGKPCDIIHIVKLDDSRQSAFLIQDMFPITDGYIEREYHSRKSFDVDK